MIRKIFLVLLFLSVPLVGAEVQGSTYRWSDLEEVPSLIQVYRDKELVHQEVLNESGTYSIELSEGNFSIIATYGNLTSYQEVSLMEGDAKTIDLVLMPGEEYLFPGVDDLPEYGEGLIPSDVLENETEEEPEEPMIGGREVTHFEIYLTVVVLVVLLSLTYFLKKRGEKNLKKSIPSDEEEVMNILKNKGGEVYQSTVKEETGFSAAKTSELLSKMEEKELIKREKKGRNKIVKLEH